MNEDFYYNNHIYDKQGNYVGLQLIKIRDSLYLLCLKKIAKELFINYSSISDLGLPQEIRNDLWQVLIWVNYRRLNEEVKERFYQFE